MPQRSRPRLRRLLVPGLPALAACALLAAGVSCGGPSPVAPKGAAAAPSAVEGARPAEAPGWGGMYIATGGAPGSGGGTVEEARAFVADVDRALRVLWAARDRASWVNQNFITGDTQALAAAGEEATASFVSRAVQGAKRFDGVKLPADLSRQLLMLRVSQVLPAPPDPKEGAELAALLAAMTSHYGKAQVCPPRLGGKCLTIDDVSRTFRTSRSYDELLDAWKGWHETARPLRDSFARYVELGNKGARSFGQPDLGAHWRSGYDMTPEQMAADVDRLWAEVRPLYEQLHCYVRGRLAARYGAARVDPKGPIPAHLLGNIWGQDWSNVFDLVEPYRGQPSLDVSRKISAKKLDAVAMVKVGERFFTSLGFDPLPKTFWERSLFTRPRDRDVLCHPSAWDVGWNDDLRLKMCIGPTEEDLVTIHHELGHDYYYHSYFRLPILFQLGANDGFHEGIGDTLALSVTPAYLKSIGLLDAAPNDEKAVLGAQMKMALQRVAMLPFALVVDKWRWDVFAGKVTKERYNEAWWALRRSFQGVAPPLARSAEDFDPGAKYHVPTSTPYLRYFLALIYQFQFHRALCKAAGQTGPLHQCSIFGSAPAGAKLRAMLALGAEKPWPEAMAVLGAETRGDASALLEYFAPLRAWLAEKNKGATCGW